MISKITSNSDSFELDLSLSKILEQPNGLEKIAVEKLPPFIRESRDYVSFGRSVLLTHDVTGEDCQLINGEPFVYYSKDFTSHAAFYGEDPQIPRLQIEGEGVNVGIITLSSDDTTIDLKRLMVQKFNYLERVREISGQAVAKLEDKKILNLLETLLLGSGTAAAPEHAAQVATTADTELSKSHLVELKKKLTQHDVPIAAFVLNPSTIDDILKWSDSEVDPLTQREMLESGVKYSIWGTVKLVPSTIIASDVVYAFADQEFVGRMPILKDLSVILTQTDNKLMKGLFMFEFLGFYLASHKAIAKLILSFTTGDAMVDTAYVQDVTAGSVVGTGVGTVI